MGIGSKDTKWPGALPMAVPVGMSWDSRPCRDLHDVAPTAELVVVTAPADAVLAHFRLALDSPQRTKSAGRFAAVLRRGTGRVKGEVLVRRVDPTKTIRAGRPGGSAAGAHRRPAVRDGCLLGPCRGRAGARFRHHGFRSPPQADRSTRGYDPRTLSGQPDRSPSGQVACALMIGSSSQFSHSAMACKALTEAFTQSDQRGR